MLMMKFTRKYDHCALACSQKFLVNYHFFDDFGVKAELTYV